MNERDRIARAMIPRPNPFRQQRPMSYLDTLQASYGDLEKQMGIPEMDRVVFGGERIKNAPPLRPTTQQDWDLRDITEGQRYRTMNAMVDPEEFRKTWQGWPSSTSIDYRYPVTPEDFYGDAGVRTRLGTPIR